MSPLARIKWLDLPGNPEGVRQLTFLELDARLPFPVKRLYWIHALAPGDFRGHHAHRTTQQLLVAVSGRVRIRFDDGELASDFVLDNPAKALWIPAGLWREFEILDEYAVVLVLASTHFDEGDYIRDYDEYKAYSLSLRT